MSDETRDRVMEAVRAVVTRSDVISFRVDADMGLYAAHSPRDMNLLLRPAPEPHPRSILLDLDGGIQPDDAAVLGFLAYLPPGCPPERLLYCLESVLRGFSYAPEPWDRWFHHGRERGILTVEERRILSVYGRGRSHERVAEQVGLSAPTYRRRLAGIRRKLQLQPREDLRLVAMARLGYG